MIQETLCDALLPPGSDLAREMLMHASVVLDIGRSVDYYRRHEHAAMILRSSGLNGFGHREILYLSLILDLGEELDWRGKDYRPLLRNGDLAEIARSAVLLSVADEIEHRILPRRVPHLDCRVSGRVRWRSTSPRSPRGTRASWPLRSRGCSARRSRSSPKPDLPVARWPRAASTAPPAGSVAVPGHLSNHPRVRRSGDGDQPIVYTCAIWA